MKILLINPPSLLEGTKSIQPIPLGLLFIKSFLQKNGYSNVEMLNLAFCNNWVEVERKIKERKEVDIIGITCYTRQRFSVERVASIIKKIDSKSCVVLGGPHVSYLANDVLQAWSDVDIVIKGEGEEIFLDIARNIDLNRGFSAIPNIVYRQNDNIVTNKLIYHPLDLYKINTPYYNFEELTDLNRNESLNFHLDFVHNYTSFIAPIIASRGCNGSCNFCCNRSYWGKQRYHCVDDVISQVMHYYDMGVKKFDFYDDNFLGNKAIVRDFLQKFIDKKIDVSWWCSCRADSIDSEILPLMKKTGCRLISVGLETGSQKILDNMCKDIKLHEAIKSLSDIKKANIDVRITISIGHDGENIQTILETISTINKIKPKQIAIYLLKVYPGTDLCKMMERSGAIDSSYWFNKDEEIVPYYTREMKKNLLIHYREEICKAINCKKRISVDELGDVEIECEW